MASAEMNSVTSWATPVLAKWRERGEGDKLLEETTSNDQSYILTYKRQDLHLFHIQLNVFILLFHTLNHICKKYVFE